MADNQEFLFFTIEHDLKSMSRFCRFDERYEMTFEKKNGEKVKFQCSRADVAAKYGDECKDLSVIHFEQMAMAWYDEKYPKECQKVK